MLATISGHLTVELQFNAFTYTVLVYHLHHLPLRFAKSSIKKNQARLLREILQKSSKTLATKIMQESYKSSKTLAKKSCKSLKNQARLLQQTMQESYKIKQDSCKKIMQESKKLCKRCLKDSCMISDMNHARFLQDKYCICKKCLLHNLIISERNYSRNAKKMQENYARNVQKSCTQDSCMIFDKNYASKFCKKCSKLCLKSICLDARWFLIRTMQYCSKTNLYAWSVEVYSRSYKFVHPELRCFCDGKREGWVNEVMMKKDFHWLHGFCQAVYN